MQRRVIPDELLGAYHDQELDEATRAWLAAELAADPELQARLTAIRDADGWIKAAFTVDEVHIPAPVQSTAAPIWTHWKQAGAMAAMLVLGVLIGGQWKAFSPSAPVGPAALTAHLETQPVFQQVMEQRLSGEAQGWDSVVLSQGQLMPVETYRLASGTYCRRFLLQTASTQLNGVVCRDTQAVWRIHELQFNPDVPPVRT